MMRQISKLLLLVLLIAGWSNADVIYQTDFSEGFTAGEINGQDGWTFKSGNSAWNLITSDGYFKQFGNSGKQRVYHIISESPLLQVDVTYKMQSVHSSTGNITLGANFDYGTLGGPKVTFGPATSTTSYVGPIQAITYEGTQSVMNYTVGWMYNISMLIDTAAKTYDLTVTCLNNSSTVTLYDLAYETNDWTTEEINNITFSYSSTSWQSGAFVDSLSIQSIPEPATVALIGLAMIAKFSYYRK